MTRVPVPTEGHAGRIRTMDGGGWIQTTYMSMQGGFATRPVHLDMQWLQDFSQFKESNMGNKSLESIKP